MAIDMSLSYRGIYELYIIIYKMKKLISVALNNMASTLLIERPSVYEGYNSQTGIIFSVHIFEKFMIILQSNSYSFTGK
jgi:hypothetical protein